jgi:hypothetical protein
MKIKLWHKPISVAVGAFLIALPTIAWATGVLAISAVTFAPATLSNPATVTVTGTCVQGPQPVKVFLRNTATSAATKVYTSGGCGATAATAGRTVTATVPALPAGNYEVVLKQGSGISLPFGPIVIP